MCAYVSILTRVVFIETTSIVMGDSGMHVNVSAPPEIS